MNLFSLFLFFSLTTLFSSLYFMVLNYSMILEFESSTINLSSINMTILLDWMWLLFMSFVLFISSMVVFCWKEYMEGNLNINRFIMLFSMFGLSMMLQIIRSNLIKILLDWDGLGLVSYCLVIYYQNVKSFNAVMLTALTNRIGDVALSMSIVWLLNYGSWNYIFYIVCMKSDFYMELISLFRFSSQTSLNLMMILMFIGKMIMFMAGLGANFEFDLKKKMLLYKL